MKNDMKAMKKEHDTSNRESVPSLAANLLTDVLKKVIQIRREDVGINERKFRFYMQ